jgi:hypothetical protein
MGNPNKFNTVGHTKPTSNFCIISPCIVDLHHMPTPEVRRSQNTFIVYDKYNTVQLHQYMKILNLFWRAQGGTLHTLAKIREHQLSCPFATEIIAARHPAMTITYHKTCMHGNCHE